MVYGGSVGYEVGVAGADGFFFQVVRPAASGSAAEDAFDDLVLVDVQ